MPGGKILLCDCCELEKTAALCRKHRVGIEAQSFYDPAMYSDETIGKHARLLEGIAPAALHGPYVDLCPGSIDGAVRETTELRFIDAAAIAESLSIDKIILHNGFVPGTSHLENYVGRAVMFWTGLLGKIGGDIRVFLENRLEDEPAALIDVVDGVASDRLGINLDVGHAAAASKKSVLHWIERCGRRIQYLHLYDNHGAGDERLAPGRGNIPFPEVLAAVRQYCDDPFLAIETDVPALEESLGRLLAWL